MLDALKDSFKALLQVRQKQVVIGGAALGIAVAVYLSNAGSGNGQSCPAQPEAAAAIESVAQGELAALQATGTGRQYADLAFVDETGRPMSLKDFAGKPILVNFWATWCVPCREEMPALNALAAAYSNDVFAVVPINLDLGTEGISKARHFFDETALGNLPLLADPTFDAFERLKSQGVALGLPATLLLDSAGCELAVLQGPAQWDGADAHRVIEKLISLKK